MKIRNLAVEVCLLSALCAAAGMVSPAATFTVLKRFNGTNGGAPFAPMVQGLDGNLYGTTEYGGANSKGTVFKLTPAGILTTLYSFCNEAACADGSSPLAGLVQAANGDFYGTAWAGGANGIGSIFSITPGGSLTTVYSFCAFTNCTDGAQPQTGLVQGGDGNLYGVTLDGGTNGNYGTLYKVTPGGFLTTLHSFCADAGCADGSTPYAVIVQGSDTKYYGTTESYGAHNEGTVFKTSPAGELTTIYAFCVLSGCADGAGPTAGVVEDSDANYYGTTVRGGIANTACNLGCGTIFKITPEGTLTTLHSFTSTDGSAPSLLIRGSDNNLYGTTESGGAYGKGTIFEITMNGTFTSLHSFSSGDGISPIGGLMQSTDGNFYGTTELSGSTANLGTIYRLSTGLGPFVKTLTSSGKPGTAVKILGTNLTGSTSVTFNGTSATFSVVSASEISATIPTGTTTGKVQVMTPGGMLSTNMAFVVLP